MREGVLLGPREGGAEVERLVQVLEVEVPCERGDEASPVVRQSVVRLDLWVVESREVARRLPRARVRIRAFDECVLVD